MKATTKPHTASIEAGMKALLLDTLREVMTRDGLSQNAVASAVGVNQPKVSGVLSGRAAISSEQVMKWLAMLGYDVSIDVQRAAPRRKAGRLSVRLGG